MKERQKQPKKQRPNRSPYVTSQYGPTVTFRPLKRQMKAIDDICAVKKCSASDVIRRGVDLAIAEHDSSATSA